MRIVGLSYEQHTTLHPAGIAAAAVLSAATCALPRRWALFPLLVMACFISQAQRLVVAGFDFNLLRVIVLFGTLRILLRREYVGFVWVKLDTMIVAWAVCSTVVYSIQQGSVDAVVFRAGTSYDAIGAYFMFRCILREWADFECLATGIAICAITVAGCFAVEAATGRNAFAVLGGVPEFTEVREGKRRCQGAFPHAIIAGCFWAALMPFCFALLWAPSRVRQAIGVAGVLSAVLIIVLSASSTPVLALVAAAIAGAGFLFRERLGSIRVLTCLVLIALHFVMKGPVWSLLARVDVIGGSTGYYRYVLVDACINQFGEWVVCGTPDTAHWGQGLYDVTNQYVLEAVQGGLITLVVFVYGLWVGFTYVGKAWRRWSRQSGHLAFVWCAGVSLFVHAVNFLGVSYFGQISVLWYLSLASVAAIESMRLRPLVETDGEMSVVGSPGWSGGQSTRDGVRSWRADGCHED
jgi:hypothetical protein